MAAHDYSHRGVDPNQVVNARHYQRDTRRPSERFAASVRKPENIAISCFVTAGIVFFYPALVDVGLVLALLATYVGFTGKPALPLKLPAWFNGLDPHDPLPGAKRGFRRARGMLYLGNDRQTGAELYESDDDARTHFLTVGGTGSGKTVFMTSMSGISLLWGSGFCYIDGKGDSALWTSIFSMMRACGREDDLLIINYMTGSTTIDPDAPSSERLTNTFNPFAMGSADSMIQLLVSLMAEAGGDSATWKEKAIGLMTAMMLFLYPMRERGRNEVGEPFVLDVSAIRHYMPLDSLINVYLRAQHDVDGFTLTPTALRSLEAYLRSVPGFQPPEKLWAQSGQGPFSPEVIREKRYPDQSDPQTYLQHGYLQNQFTRILSQLADVYGHIYRVQLGEVDMADVVLNRRCLVVLLPAMEKSPDELAGLGKIIVAAKKTMYAVGLGAQLEGSHRAVIDSKPIHAPSPFLDMNDEYGFYPVKGYPVVAAQARSLGISCTFGGQTVGSFGRESKEDAEDIFGNTLTKIAMRIEDAGQSFELFQKTAGEVLVTQTSGFARHDNALMSSYYHDTHNASVEKRSRIDLLDVRDQREGQAHVFRGSTIVRAQLFYANIGNAREYRINRFIPVLPARDSAITDSQRWADPAEIQRAIAQALDAPCPPLDGLKVDENPTLANLRRERSNKRFAQSVIAYLLQQYAAKERDTVAGLTAALQPSANPTAASAAQRPAKPEIEVAGWTTHSAPLNAYQSGTTEPPPVPVAVHPLDDGPIWRIVDALTVATGDGQLDVEAASSAVQDEKARLAQDRILQTDPLLHGSVIRSVLPLRLTPALSDLLTDSIKASTDGGVTTTTGASPPLPLAHSTLRDGLQHCESSAHGLSGTAQQQTEAGLSLLQGPAPATRSNRVYPTPQKLNHTLNSMAQLFNPDSSNTN